MIRINHDTIEIDGEVAANFLPGFSVHKRIEIRDMLELEFAASRMIDDGEYVTRKELDEAETGIAEYQKANDKTKGDLQHAMSNFDDVFDKLGKKTRDKIIGFLEDLTAIVEDIKL